jgi:hypothetical protein
VAREVESPQPGTSTPTLGHGYSEIPRTRR